MEEKELLDLENSFEELKILELAKHLVLPINAKIELWQEKIEKLKFPLWIKLNSSEHKAKIKAIERCFSWLDLEKKYSKLKKSFPDKKFIVQEDVSGVEIIAGIKQDKTFGKVLLVGAGGSLAEIIKDTEFRVLPIEKTEIEEAIKQLKIYKILEEKQANISKLISLVYDFSKLKIEEADLNPIIVNEKEAKVVDARLSLGE